MILEWKYTASRSGQRGTSGYGTYTHTVGLRPDEDEELSRITRYVPSIPGQRNIDAFGIRRLTSGRLAVFQVCQGAADDLGRSCYFAHAFIAAPGDFPHPPWMYFRSRSFQQSLTREETLNPQPPPLLDPGAAPVPHPDMELLLEQFRLGDFAPACLALAAQVLGEEKPKPVLVAEAHDGQDAVNAFALLWTVAIPGARGELSLMSHQPEGNGSAFTVVGWPRDFGRPPANVISRFHSIFQWVPPFPSVSERPLGIEESAWTDLFPKSPLPPGIDRPPPLQPAPRPLPPAPATPEPAAPEPAASLVPVPTPLPDPFTTDAGPSDNRQPPPETPAFTEADAPRWLIECFRHRNEGTLPLVADETIILATHSLEGQPHLQDHFIQLLEGLKFSDAHRFIDRLPPRLWSTLMPRIAGLFPFSDWIEHAPEKAGNLVAARLFDALAPDGAIPSEIDQALKWVHTAPLSPETLAAFVDGFTHGRSLRDIPTSILLRFLAWLPHDAGKFFDIAVAVDGRPQDLTEANLWQAGLPGEVTRWPNLVLFQHWQSAVVAEETGNANINRVLFESDFRPAHIDLRRRVFLSLIRRGWPTPGQGENDSLQHFAELLRNQGWPDSNILALAARWGIPPATEAVGEPGPSAPAAPGEPASLPAARSPALQPTIQTPVSPKEIGALARKENAARELNRQIAAAPYGSARPRPHNHPGKRPGSASTEVTLTPPTAPASTPENPPEDTPEPLIEPEQTAEAAPTSHDSALPADNQEPPAETDITPEDAQIAPIATEDPRDPGTRHRALTPISKIVLTSGIVAVSAVIGYSVYRLTTPLEPDDLPPPVGEKSTRQEQPPPEQPPPTPQATGQERLAQTDAPPALATPTIPPPTAPSNPSPPTVRAKEELAENTTPSPTTAPALDVGILEDIDGRLADQDFEAAEKRLGELRDKSPQAAPPASAIDALRAKIESQRDEFNKKWIPEKKAIDEKWDFIFQKLQSVAVGEFDVASINVQGDADTIASSLAHYQKPAKEPAKEPAKDQAKPGDDYTKPAKEWFKAHHGVEKDASGGPHYLSLNELVERETRIAEALRSHLSTFGKLNPAIAGRGQLEAAIAAIDEAAKTLPKDQSPDWVTWLNVKKQTFAKRLSEMPVANAGKDPSPAADQSAEQQLLEEASRIWGRIKTAVDDPTVPAPDILQELKAFRKPGGPQREYLARIMLNFFNAKRQLPPDKSEKPDKTQPPPPPGHEGLKNFRLELELHIRNNTPQPAPPPPRDPPKTKANDPRTAHRRPLQPPSTRPFA